MYMLTGLVWESEGLQMSQRMALGIGCGEGVVGSAD